MSIPTRAVVELGPSRELRRRSWPSRCWWRRRASPCQRRRSRRRNAASRRSGRSRLTSVPKFAIGPCWASSRLVSVGTYIGRGDGRHGRHRRDRRDRTHGQQLPGLREIRRASPASLLVVLGRRDRRLRGKTREPETLGRLHGVSSSLWLQVETASPDRSGSRSEQGVSSMVPRTIVIRTDVDRVPARGLARLVNSAIEIRDESERMRELGSEQGARLEAPTTGRADRFRPRDDSDRTSRRQLGWPSTFDA